MKKIITLILIVAAFVSAEDKQRCKIIKNTKTDITIETETDLRTCTLYAKKNGKFTTFQCNGKKGWYQKMTITETKEFVYRTNKFGIVIDEHNVSLDKGTTPGTEFDRFLDEENCLWTSEN